MRRLFLVCKPVYLTGCRCDLLAELTGKNLHYVEIYHN